MDYGDWKPGVFFYGLGLKKRYYILCNGNLIDFYSANHLGFDDLFTRSLRETVKLLRYDIVKKKEYIVWIYFELYNI